MRAGLVARGAGPLGVIVTDTFGRPWREGLVDVALGCAGLAPLDDLRGSADLRGRTLAGDHRRHRRRARRRRGSA